MYVWVDGWMDGQIERERDRDDKYRDMEIQICT